MNLKQLEYFVQVAELGSFSKAALALDIAQPALSRQVRALETELHQQLFLRNGRGVALTDAGKRLFDHSVAVLQLVSHAREDLGASRDEPVGRVTIGLPPSIGRQFTLPMKELSRYPLIVPERVHAMRRLLETQAALAGVKLDIAWEVSSVPSIIELVCAGYGHAVLTASGMAASTRAGDLVIRPLVEPT